MSKYFDGYASWKYQEMSKEKLIAELKEKVRYIGELKRNQKEEISKIQSARDKQLQDNQNQKAVEALQKVKIMTEWKLKSIVEVVDFIDQLIKELGGKE